MAFEVCRHGRHGLGVSDLYICIDIGMVRSRRYLVFQGTFLSHHARDLHIFLPPSYLGAREQRHIFYVQEIDTPRQS